MVETENVIIGHLLDKAGKHFVGIFANGTEISDDLERKCPSIADMDSQGLCINLQVDRFLTGRKGPVYFIQQALDDIQACLVE